MRYLTLILAASFCFSSFAIAMDDDFGARFTDQTPAALDDGSLGIENIPPELIEPAAGDYFDSEEQGVEEAPESEKSESENSEEQEIDL